MTKNRAFWEDLAQRQLTRFDFPPSGLNLGELLRQGARPAWAQVQEQKQRNRPRATTETKKERPRTVARERTIQTETKYKDRDSRSKKQTKQKAKRVCAKRSNYNLTPTGTKDIARGDNKTRTTTEQKMLDPQKIRRVSTKRSINPSTGTKDIGRRDNQLSQLATRQEK